MPFVDAHCHLDQYNDPRAVASRAEASRTYTVAVTNLPSIFRHTERLAEGMQYVRAAAGLHPELVYQHRAEVVPLLALLERTKYVGEVGLDYSRADDDNRACQRATLERITSRCEELGGRVISIHSRRAAPDAIAILIPLRRSKVILHWFSGSLSAARQAIEAGFYFSVNPSMLRSTSGARLIAEIPDHLLLTESDGPFVKVVSSPVEPAGMSNFIAELARVRGTHAPELERGVVRNFGRAVALAAT
jgi:TatD DNase family protein